MPVKTQVTGSGWATSGAASAGSVGVNTVTNLTHVASTDIPPGSSASGYLTAPENTAPTIKIDASYSGAGELDASGTEMWIRLWVRCVTSTDASVPADGTTPSSALFTQASAGTKYRSQILRVRRAPNSVGNIAGGTFPADYDGLTMNIAQTITGGTLTTEPNSAATGDPAIIPFDAWCELVFHVKRHATEGEFGAYLNGQCVGILSGIDTDTNTDTASTILNADIKSDWTVTLSAIAGCTWQICAPLESWTGNDITVRPLWSVLDSGDVRYIASCRFPDQAQGGSFSTSGTATSTPTTYGNSGNHPGRTRFVVAGTNGQVKVFTSYDSLGTLPYNERGVASILFPMVYCPASSTAVIAVRNAGNTADVASIAFNGTNITVNGVTVCTHATTSRWAIALHFDSGGKLYATAHDLTTSATQRTFSVDCGTWTPAALGIITMTLAFTGSVSAELDGFEVHKWLNAFGVDSYSQTVTASLSPSHTIANYLARALHYRATERFPGGAHRHRGSSIDRLTTSLILGYSGKKFVDFTDTTVLPGLGYARGMRLWVFCGYTNDIAAITTAASRMALMTTLETALRKLCRVMVAGGNKVRYVIPVRPGFETAVTITVAATTATVTHTAHGFTTGDKISIVKSATPSLNIQQASITVVDANTYTYTTSGSGTAVAAYARYWSDEQMIAYRQAADMTRRVLREEQRGSLLEICDIDALLPRHEDAFVGGDSIHPTNAYGTLMAQLMALSSTVGGTSSASTPTGWKRPQRRIFTGV